MNKWSIKELGRLIEEVSERNRNTNCLDVYSVTNSQGFIPSKDYFNKKVFSKDISNYKLVHRGMFAYNPSRINVGSIAWLREKDCVAVSPLYVVFRINEDMVLQKWIEYFLRSNIGLAQICSLTSGSVRDTLKYSALERIEIPIAPITEQREMVKKLEDIDQAIKMCNRLMEKTEDLVKSRFVEMFGEGAYPSFKLKDICSKITDGTHKTPTYQVNGVPFVSAKNIKDGKLLFDNVKYISNQEYDEIQRRCQISNGDLLLTKSGSLGIPALVDVDFPFGIFESLAVLKYDREKINGVFLHSQIRSDRFQHDLAQGVKGIAVKHLHLNVIGTSVIIVPPLTLQNEFAAFVEQVDKSKLIIQELLKKHELLKEALMQKYFA